MKKFFSLLAVLISVALVVWGFFAFKTKPQFATAEILGGVVRIHDDSGDRLYYLTSQWEKLITRTGSRSSSSTRTTSWLNVDLWTLDAKTAQPVSRKRLKRDKVNGDLKALGVDQGVLWARIPELVGIRLSDGVVVADSAKIEARNPGLAGLMPKPAQAGTFLTEQMQALKFEPEAGVVVRLDDARRMRIDPLTLEATPYVPPTEEKKPDNPGDTGIEKAPADARKAMLYVSNGMDWYAMLRGQAMKRADGGTDWLGLLADTELANAKEQGVVSNQMDFTEPRRHRLYRARLEREENFMGIKQKFVDPAPLPESPEFLMAGLLTAGPGGYGGYGEKTVLNRRDPDSVFVISRDRLGDDGRLQLARIAGPGGRVVWSTALPLANMGVWIPGERHALMLGPDPSAPRYAKAEERENPVMQIISIDLETGTLATFNPDLHRDWPVDGAKDPK